MNLTPLLLALVSAALPAAAREYSHPSGFGFTYGDAWSVEERAEPGAESVRLKPPVGKAGQAGISVQRYAIPYRKAGAGQWRSGKDYLHALRREAVRVNRFGKKVSGKDLVRIAALPDIPAKRGLSGLTLSQEGSRSAVVVVERKADFLVLAYGAPEKDYARHWSDFLKLLESFRSE